MDANALTRRRNPWVAAGLSLALPGLGQVYNGELLKGVCLYVLVVLVQAAGFAAAMLLPDPWMLRGLVLAALAFVGLYAFCAAEAVLRARRLGAAYLPRSVNRWYVYAALWIAGFLVFNVAVQGYLKTHWVRFFKVASASMEPLVLAGDYVVADMSVFRREPVKAGDVVVFVYPDDRSRVYLKRVLALPGRRIPGSKDENAVVPHGHVWVGADRKQGTVDSRVFGPVPLADVMGKVRQVYFSRGAGGVRWGRMGRIVGAEPPS